MQIPMTSTAVLVVELLVAILIGAIISQGYVRNNFLQKTALFAILYEIVLNVGYMVYRFVGIGASKASKLSAGMKIVGTYYGFLSLVMLG